MTAGKTVAALPDIAMGKPTVVTGFGMLKNLVFGRNKDGELFFNTDGKNPDDNDDNKKSPLTTTETK